MDFYREEIPHIWVTRYFEASLLIFRNRGHKTMRKELKENEGKRIPSEIEETNL